MTSAVVDFEEPVDRKARTTAWIITGSVALVLLLLLWFIKIYTVTPPIPADVEAPALEIDLGSINGGTNQEMGGGSFGNTGDPGSQNMDANPNPADPSNPGAITNDASDVEHTKAQPTPGSNEASVSDETKALMDKLKNKKSNTTIKIGGDGTGSPYSSGVGGGTGPGVGPNDGGIPGKTPGDGNGKTVRHIIFKPDIANPTQEEAVVAVVVRVRRDGTVEHAEYTPKGTTTGNSLLHSTATQSAYKIRFDEDPNGPELLLLTININFTLTK
jgi:hypothetical protein